MFEGVSQVVGITVFDPKAMPLGAFSGGDPALQKLVNLEQMDEFWQKKECQACKSLMMVARVADQQMCWDEDNPDQRYTITLDVKFCISCGVSEYRSEIDAYTGY